MTENVREGSAGRDLFPWLWLAFFYLLAWSYVLTASFFLAPVHAAAAAQTGRALPALARSAQLMVHPFLWGSLFALAAVFFIGPLKRRPLRAVGKLLLAAAFSAVSYLAIGMTSLWVDVAAQLPGLIK
ncbi:MAG: hypothetical protein HY554_05245 [Elusimicrobia bacterium]|nr:hypothetical protein [Elusimicrobiota bacterium]